MQTDILSLPVLKADHRLPYGPDPVQFGDLWLPETHDKKLLPLVVFFHGGWWKSEYDLGYAGYLCAALKKEGIACWSVEYRRVGDTGGGWPATFQDAAAGFDFISELAKKYPLDLQRVVTMGHSAGGHLAFWVAGRQHVEASSEVHIAKPARGPNAAIALAGAVDLRLTIELSGDGLFAHDRREVVQLMGGTPEQYPQRYRNGNPGELLPMQAPQLLIQGTEDNQIPPALPGRWAAAAKASGSQAEVKMLRGADHFDVVDPRSAAWPEIRNEILRIVHSSTHA
ncbi:MAG TPA: alpha/beta hydrolase [Acidobacteriaceae bacterium]